MFPPTREETKQARQRLEFIAFNHGIQPRGYSVREIVGMLKSRKFKLGSEEKDVLIKVCEINGMDYNKVRVFSPYKEKKR